MLSSLGLQAFAEFRKEEEKIWYGTFFEAINTVGKPRWVDKMPEEKNI